MMSMNSSISPVVRIMAWVGFASLCIGGFFLSLAIISLNMTVTLIAGFFVFIALFLSNCCLDVVVRMEVIKNENRKEISCSIPFWTYHRWIPCACALCSLVCVQKAVCVLLLYDEICM